MHKLGVLALSIAAAALGACSGRSGYDANAGAGPGFAPQAMPGMAITFALPARTIGEELPSEGVGTKKDPKWGTVGGFTQTGKAQVLGFPPGTKVTIRNLSNSIPHTLNVVGLAGKPPAHFPANPQLSFTAKGHGVLAKGYASGQINPGGKITVKLSKAGTYLIGCAFHYSEGMRDVIVVAKGAKPGPAFVR
jgi:plastocyanin